MNPSPRDKYGFKSLAVGESKTVQGATKKQAQSAASMYANRHECMVHRDFVWSAVAGGVEVKRIR